MTDMKKAAKRSDAKPGKKPSQSSYPRKGDDPLDMRPSKRCVSNL